ncbi:hypothetical protein APHAL10511_001092 [Amanita phalloides]|nr:hypothetical protein APHAL10511_001092 [Amanita phalloides]
MPLPALGTRIDYTGHHGTIRYVGCVANSSTPWLGVEWDDPTRGKHDGLKDRKRYFQCLVPGAGSFIRPSPKISFGTSFLDALSSKYIESLHGSQSQESVILGSSNGSIHVHAIHLDKIRRKLSDLSRLREVSLDRESVAHSDPPGAIFRTCPSEFCCSFPVHCAPIPKDIHGLDLSNSLIPSWNVVAQIASELPSLGRLALNRTRISLPNDTDRFTNAFPCLVELQLNRTMTSWSAMIRVISMMPRLQLVEMGHNQLTRLHAADDPIGLSAVQSVNLDGNLCNDWINLYSCLVMYPSLHRIVLSYNCLESIPFPDVPTLPLVGIKHLALSFNQLRSWHDVDALTSWCPNLETLTLGGNPLAVESEKNFRPLTIARIPSLKTLDGSAISHKEREDCELFYLSHVAPHELAREYPRWQELRSKHGRTEQNPTSIARHDRLKDHMITLNVFSTSAEVDTNSKCLTLSVIPSMTLRTLRVKISRALTGRAGKGKGKVVIWQRMQDGLLLELDHSRDTQDLAWIGLEDGVSIVCTPQDE